MATSAEVDDYVWEVEALEGGLGGRDKRWIDARTNLQIASLDAISPPIGYKWKSNWRSVLDKPGSDDQGWLIEGATRKRMWARRRERAPSASMQSSSTSSSSSSSNGAKPLEMASSKVGAATATDDASAQQALTENLRRLDRIVAEISIVLDRSSLDALLKESRERTETANALISKLGVSEKATIRAAATKLGNDLLKTSKRIDAACSEAVSRVGLLGKSGKLADLSGDLASRRDEEEAAARARAEALERQQANLRRMEQEHQQVLRKEVDVTMETIEQRHESILEANKKAEQLNGMMRQLTTLVSEQKDQVKTVVKATEQSRDNAVKGLKEIQKAEQYQQDGSGCIIS